MKPTVLLDVDGILADFTRAALDLVHQVTGRRYLPDAVRTWEVFDSIPEPAARHEVYRILKGPGGCESIPVCEGAIEGVRKLRELAHIVCVTSPFKGSPTWAHERELWLEKHFGGEISYVIHTRHKERIHGDVFIDDKPEHVEGWMMYWHDHGEDAVVPILWKTDRTIHTISSRFVHEATSWDTILKIVRDVFY